MAIHMENMRISKPLRRLGNLLWSSAVLLYFFTLGIMEIYAANTGCSAVYTAGSGYIDPGIAYKLECPNPPCAPNACNWSWQTNQPSSGCGPITACALTGEDPPSSSPLWNEAAQGVTVLGQNIMSGKCAPPGPNSVPPWSINCPAAANSSIVGTVTNGLGR